MPSDYSGRGRPPPTDTRAIAAPARPAVDDDGDAETPLVKVLVVIDALNFGGAENVLVTLAGHARELGLDLQVLSLSPPTAGRAEWESRLRAAGLPVSFLNVRRLADPRVLVQLARFIRGSGCSVVHAHLETSSTLVPVAARLVGVPAVCTLHHVPVPLVGRDAVKERLAVMSASQATALILVSQASHDGFAASYPASHRRGRWRVVHNGVDLDKFRPLADGERAELPADLGAPVGAPVVTLGGQMRPGKGQDVAIRAWPAVLAGFPDARLLLVGSGPLEDELKGLARDLGVEHRVVFAGTRDDMEAILPRSTLVVLPTRMEALPTVLLEAAASGVPSVATSVGGVPEVVVDGETGWLVPELAPDAFAGAVTAALGQRTELAARGRRARARAEELFDARRWSTDLAAEYRRLAGHR